MTPEKLRHTISRNVKQRRKELGMTQAALAAACEVTAAAICRLESGVSGASDEMLAYLSEALHCHPAALMMEGVTAKNLKIGA